MTEQTWTIEDVMLVNGKTKRIKRTVTLAQFRAEIEDRKRFCATISDAYRRMDADGVAKAQDAMRKRFA